MAPPTASWPPKTFPCPSCSHPMVPLEPSRVFEGTRFYYQCGSGKCGGIIQISILCFTGRFAAWRNWWAQRSFWCRLRELQRLFAIINRKPGTTKMLQKGPVMGVYFEVIINRPPG